MSDDDGEEPRGRGYASQDPDRPRMETTRTRLLRELTEATMDGEKRVTKVYRVSEFPSGVRRRGWGLLHDQIWFYDEPPRGRGVRIAVEGLDGCGDVDPFEMDGKWWRKDDGRWLRLYMDRRVLWLPFGLRIRIHTFHSGDDDGAFHDHPWNFVTLPLRSYTEHVEIVNEEDVRMGDVPLRYEMGTPGPRGSFDEGFSSGAVIVQRVVRALRPHYRPKLYRHIVLEPDRPFTTIVFSWGVTRRWGFWPEPDRFVPFDEWTEYE